MNKIKLKKLKKKEKNNIYEYGSSYLPNSSFEVVSYNCHEHIIEISHMKFEFIYKFYKIIWMECCPSRKFEIL